MASRYQSKFFQASVKTNSSYLWASLFCKQVWPNIFHSEEWQNHSKLIKQSDEFGLKLVRSRNTMLVGRADGRKSWRAFRIISAWQRSRISPYQASFHLRFRNDNCVYLRYCQSKCFINLQCFVQERLRAQNRWNQQNIVRVLWTDRKSTSMQSRLRNRRKH